MGGNKKNVVYNAIWKESYKGCPPKDKKILIQTSNLHSCGVSGIKRKTIFIFRDEVYEKQGQELYDILMCSTLRPWQISNKEKKFLNSQKENVLDSCDDNIFRY